MSGRVRSIGLIVVGVVLGLIITNVTGRGGGGDSPDDVGVSSAVVAEGEGCVLGELQRPHIAVPLVVDFLASGLKEIESGKPWKPESGVQPNAMLIEYDNGQCIQMTCLDYSC
jgi:hypothetical protein